MTQTEKETLRKEFNHFICFEWSYDGAYLIKDTQSNEIFDFMVSKIDKLQAFKEYVHKRLDDAGIEKDPESEHKEAGCRIGGRLDIVLNMASKLQQSQAKLEEKETIIRALKDAMIKGNDLYDSILWEGEPVPKRVAEIRELKAKLEAARKVIQEIRGHLYARTDSGEVWHMVDKTLEEAGYPYVPED